RDGLRIYGWAPDTADSHLPTNLGAYRAMCAAIGASVESKAAEMEEKSKLVPMLGTLEGVLDVWGAGPRSIAPHNSLARDRDGTSFGTSFYWEDPDHPRWGPSFALIARLFLLEQRIDRIARLKRLETICRTVADVRFDPLYRLRLAADPRIVVSLNQNGYPDR